MTRDINTRAQWMERVAQRLSAPTLGDDLTLTFRIRGGMPSERRDDEITVTGNGKLKARLSDRIQNLDFDFDGPAGADQLHRVALGIHRVLAMALPRDQIEFLPDEVIGSVQVRLEGESTRLHFRVDEKRLPTPQRLSADGLAALADSLTGVVRKQDEEETHG